MKPSGERAKREGSGRPASSPPVGARLAKVDELEVVVEKLIAGGDGLARWQGIPIFIPRSAPGDRLRVRLVDRRADYGRAEIVEVLTAGPGRRIPPCPHFGECGGCDLQHLEDELQLELKAGAVRETLTRLGGVSATIPTELVRGAAWGYRQRAQFHTAGHGEDLRLGFRARRGHEVVSIAACPILVPELESRLPDLVKALPDAPPKRLDVLVGDGGAMSTAPRTGHLPHGEVQVEVGEASFDLDARCFFQSHRGLLPDLVRHAVGPWRGHQAYDLYAGVGLFSLPLAQRHERVVAVEGDSVAGRFLKRNARRAHLDQLSLVHSAVESWIERMPDRPDRVVVDPPRTGLSREVCRLIGDRRPKRLTYVSCHAATLARDLKLLAAAFEIEKIIMIDLFPQTGHMEVIAHLVSEPTKR